MITATFRVGKADVLAMSMYFYESSPTVRRSRILAQASASFVLVLGAALAFFRDAGCLTLVAPLLFMAVVWAVFYPRWDKEYRRYTMEKLLREASYQKTFGTYTLNFNEIHIASSSLTGEGTYPWSSVSRISLTPDYLFIFLAGPQGYSIPRAQIPEATIQEMKAFAEKMSRRAEPGAAPNAGPASAPPAPGS